jgi:hypothetical protein
MRFPQPQPSYYYELTFACQICWRTMRWHNGRTRRSKNPNRKKPFKAVLLMGQERSAFHPGQELLLQRRRIHLRRPTCHSYFSLATSRRTIHSPTIRELSSWINAAPLAEPPFGWQGGPATMVNLKSPNRSKSGQDRCGGGPAIDTYTLSPSHDQCGMLRPLGTSSADWW